MTRRGTMPQHRDCMKPRRSSSRRGRPSFRVKSVDLEGERGDRVVYTDFHFAVSGGMHTVMCSHNSCPRPTRRLVSVKAKSWSPVPT
jgi:hypothetical protein